MEDNTVQVNEIEEYEQPDVEIEEATEISTGGVFAAGFVGGFLAYTVIWGLKKAAAFVQTKMAERERRSREKNVVDVPFNDLSDSQESPDEDTSEE